MTKIPHIYLFLCKNILFVCREFGGVELRKTTAILRTEQRSEYKALKKLKPAEKKEKYSSLLKQRKAEEVNLM